jgi:ABC-type multidrug transport system ATPase subunit
MSENEVTLRVSNVTKRFDDFTAVDDLSFEVRAGRMFGFLGPNGAGKTTTIRMIVGITAPDSGTIDYRFDGDAGTRGRRDAANENDSLGVSPSRPPAVAQFQDRIGYLPEGAGFTRR